MVQSGRRMPKTFFFWKMVTLCLFYTIFADVARVTLAWPHRGGGGMARLDGSLPYKGGGRSSKFFLRVVMGRVRHNPHLPVGVPHIVCVCVCVFINININIILGFPRVGEQWCSRVPGGGVGRPASVCGPRPPAAHAVRRGAGAALPVPERPAPRPLRAIRFMRGCSRHPS